MCHETTYRLVQVVERDLTHQARACGSPELGAIPAWLDKTVDQLHHLIGTLECGDVRAYQQVVDACHHAQRALCLLHNGGRTGLQQPGLVIQAYLRVAAHNAYSARLALDQGDWAGCGRRSCAALATPEEVSS